MIPFPKDFEKNVLNDPFLDNSLLSALDSDAPISVRLNPKKTKPQLDLTESIPWCENGYYLEKRPIFTLDPLFHAGCYYPQEAGSMVLDQVLRQLELPSAPKVLDLCAAPGGKSTLIANFLNQNGLLVANEFVHNRVSVLKENLNKWGASNVIVTNNKPSDFKQLPHFFDVIVADVPCSGEGMFRKDPDSRNEWSLKNVEMCAIRQEQIINDVWDALAPAGYLIYSTCTLNEKENESNVLRIARELDAEIIHFKVHESFVKGRNGIGYYAIPGFTKSEGFFIAILKKNDALKQKLKKTNFNDWKNFKDLTSIEKWCNTQNQDFFQWKDYVLSFPKNNVEDVSQILSTKLYVIKAGTTIATVMGNKLIPSEELVLSPFLRIPEEGIELSLDQALKYLKGETFSLTSDKDYRKVNYLGEPLGWINHLGNRFNNLYPKEWRIRMKIN
jgi:16S rRNA C967 or C1407 C5-methylase (RsmB/RsmF family)/NOL1/NOP2/fmu family ribosome biogenesis protein